MDRAKQQATHRFIVYKILVFNSVIKLFFKRNTEHNTERNLVTPNDHGNLRL